jgi:hypothetical protein
MPFDLSQWQTIFSQIASDLKSPSPLASLLSSLAVLVMVGLIYAMARKILPRPGRRTRRFSWLRNFDRKLVWYGSWVVGTHYFSVWIRRPIVLCFFGGIAVAGVVLAWPWAIWLLTFGVLGAFLVFRHWSHNEDDVEYDIRSQPQRIRVDRTSLNFELVVACSSIFIYAPVVFAQMSKDGIGFETPPDTTVPFAFVLYSIIEVLKVGAIIPYYDLYANTWHLPFENLVQKLGAVVHPTEDSKLAIFAFRASVNLIILTALKRFIDIGQRVSVGLDLRPCQDAIIYGDDPARIAAVSQLQTFGLQGRSRAGELLADILDISSGSPNVFANCQFSPDVRFAATGALVQIGSKQRDRQLLDRLIDKYEQPSRAATDEKLRAKALEKMGDIYFHIGKLEDMQQRLKLSGRAYRQAIAIYKSHESLKQDLERAQNNYAASLQLLSTRQGKAEQVAKGIEAQIDLGPQAA